MSGDDSDLWKLPRRFSTLDHETTSVMIRSSDDRAMTFCQDRRKTKPHEIMLILTGSSSKEHHIKMNYVALAVILSQQYQDKLDLLLGLLAVSGWNDLEIAKCFHIWEGARLITSQLSRIQPDITSIFFNHLASRISHATQGILKKRRKLWRAQKELVELLVMVLNLHWKLGYQTFFSRTDCTDMIYPVRGAISSWRVFVGAQYSQTEGSTSH